MRVDEYVARNVAIEIAPGRFSRDSWVKERWAPPAPPDWRRQTIVCARPGCAMGEFVPLRPWTRYCSYGCQRRASGLAQYRRRCIEIGRAPGGEVLTARGAAQAEADARWLAAHRLLALAFAARRPSAAKDPLLQSLLDAHRAQARALLESHRAHVAATYGVRAA